MAVTSTPNPDGTQTIQLSSGDDLVTRAEKIVHVLGFRGSVGDQILLVYNVLKSYKQMDEDAQD